MSEVDVQVGERTVRLSNLDKVLYPATGFTKGQVIDYYLRIADTVLPHVRNRPMTMARYPDGVGGPMFYQKRCPANHPDFVGLTQVWSETKHDDLNYCLIDDAASLAWLVNLAALELHPFLATADDVDRPTLMTFDLDPGPGTTLVDCARVAVQLRDLLREAGLESFPKTSGKKGMHLNVPINTPCTYEQTKGLSHGLAQLLEKLQSDRVTSNMRKVERTGRVFVDWSQNDEHKSTVCVYSLRVNARPTVSTPLTWEELEAAIKKGEPERLVFDTEQVLKRAEELGDLYAAMLTMKQKVMAEMMNSE